MEELESQIAKIQLGNNKSSSTFVYVLAEKSTASNTELYAVLELPLLNPVAEEDCERITLAIASALKRAYSKPGMENNFESAISQINDELGKLAGMGQTQWVDKLNGILAIKEGNSFSIATTGKVSAFLLRNKEYTDISCSPTQTHPLKTFENYASGKIRLGDLLILSTTQLFNYLSMDRLLTIMSAPNFLNSAQTIIAMLKESADSRVSFGVLLNLQVPVGQTEEQDLDLESYVVETPPNANSVLKKAWQFVLTAFAFNKTEKRMPKTDLPQVSLAQRFKNLSGNTKNIISKSRGWWQTAKTSASALKITANPQNFKQFSPQKKFFLISSLILLIAVVANIFIAMHLKKSSQTQALQSNQLKTAQTDIANAQASLLYKDYTTAANYIQQAQSSLPAAKTVLSSDKVLYNKLVSELNDARQQMEKVTQAKVTNLGALAQGSNLISLPNFLAVQTKLAIIAYSKQSGQVLDGALSSPVNIIGSVYTTGNNAVIYDGTNLYLWDFTTGKVSPGFSQNVPAQNDFGGIAYYPTNSRVYIVDKKTSQIISFLVSKTGLSKPVVSVNDPSLNQANDIAIDGNIYTLDSTGLTKFLAGHIVSFSAQVPAINFSSNSKILSIKGGKYIYILDAGNKQIIILNKDGSLFATLKSDQFTKLVDFAVDETSRTIYLLNDSNLLKTNF